MKTLVFFAFLMAFLSCENKPKNDVNPEYIGIAIVDSVTSTTVITHTISFSSIVTYYYSIDQNVFPVSEGIINLSFHGYDEAREVGSKAKIYKVGKLYKADPLLD